MSVSTFALNCAFSKLRRDRSEWLDMLGVEGSVVGPAGGGNGDVGKFGIGGGLVSNVRFKR